MIGALFFLVIFLLVIAIPCISLMIGDTESSDSKIQVTSQSNPYGTYDYDMPF